MILERQRFDEIFCCLMRKQRRLTNEPGQLCSNLGKLHLLVEKMSAALVVSNF